MSDASTNTAAQQAIKINGVSFTPEQLQKLKSKGVESKELCNYSQSQLTAMLNGQDPAAISAASSSATNPSTSAFGGLTNATKSVSDGVGSVFGGLTNIATSTVKGVANVATRTVNGVTAGLDALGSAISGQSGLYSVPSQSTVTPQSQSINAMAAKAAAGANVSVDPETANAMTKSMLTPQEQAGQAIIIDPEDGLPALKTGLVSGLKNATQDIQHTGKVSDAAKNQLSAAKNSLGTLDTQIADLEKDVSSLQNLKPTADKAYGELVGDMRKITDPAQQAKVDQYQNISAKYTDTQATANKLKGDYEMIPETTTDSQGNTIKNPQKEALKQEYEKTQKQATELEQQRNALKAEMEKNPQLQSIANNVDAINDFTSNYNIKKADLNKKKEFRESVRTQTNTLEELMTSSSGGTSTD